jgi:hypothetical protein
MGVAVANLAPGGHIRAYTSQHELEHALRAHRSRVDPSAQAHASAERAHSTLMYVSDFTDNLLVRDDLL